MAGVELDFSVKFHLARRYNDSSAVLHNRVICTSIFDQKNLCAFVGVV